MSRNLFKWLRKIIKNKIIDEMLEAIIFSISIDRKVDKIGKRLHEELKLPYFKFKLNNKQRFTSFVKYIREEYNSCYTQLLNEYLYQVIDEFVRKHDLKYSKEMFVLFIIATYRNELKLDIGGIVVDIDMEYYLETIRKIRSDSCEKAVLASLYNAYISGLTKKDMLCMLRKAEEVSKEITPDIYLDTIEEIIKDDLSPAFFLKLYNNVIKNVSKKEKIIKALNRIEHRLRLVASRKIDINKLLMLIELMKRDFQPHRHAFILILVVREQMYNIVKTSRKLFKQEVFQRSGRVVFKPIKELPMRSLREIENRIFGLDKEFYVLKTVSGILWPFGIIMGIEGRIRLGIIYLLESDTTDLQLLWRSFTDEVLSEKAKKLSFSGIIIPIASKTAFIYEEKSIESPLYTKQLYHKKTHTKGKRKKRFLEYIEVEDVKKSEVPYILNILFNLVKKTKQYEIHWTQNDIIKFSDLLRKTLKLSDLVSDFYLSNDASAKLNKLEDKIINALSQEFPEIKIEKPLDIWVLYKNEKVQRRAVNILSSFLSDVSNNPEQMALDILETAYIASILGPYIHQGKLLEYVYEEVT